MKKIKIILSCAAFLSLLLLCVNKITDIVQRKSSDFKYIPFFEQEEDFDVLFMGSSHVINAVFPMELWDDYGIVSYNFGGHANQIATTYWVMQNVLDYTEPRLMVIDVLAVGANRKVANSDYMHLSFDCFPVSGTKIRGIYDLCDDPEMVDEKGICLYDRRWEFIWDLGKYHSRWKELKENDITNENVTKEKGAESRIAVAVPGAYEIVDAAEVLEETDTIGMEYLRKMIEDCQARGIEVLLVHLPYQASYYDQAAANSVYAIAEEYGVNYINFVALDSVVDYNTDCYDAGHLNPSGARKVTDYLGEYIMEHYDIPDRQSDAAYQGWTADYQAYVDYKLDNIKEQTAIETELMLLAEDDSFSCCLYIKNGSDILENEGLCNLIMNIMETENASALEHAREKGTPYFMINDSMNQYSDECLDDKFIQETSFGSILYRQQDGQSCLYINNMEKNLLDGDWNNETSTVTEPDIWIYVIDNRTGEVAYSSMWDYKITNGISIRKN